jgi:hypothetical protein
MRINNFKELEKEIVADRDHRIEKIKNDINGTRSMFQFIGDLVELYFPRMVESVISGRGVTSLNQKPKYPNQL